ncbi:MBL fold metallo-hydrolase [Segetibacter sp. 3557_3]|uniref:MBL fold metallo-hydrolase n=1 Tax=Segetibacter sp. 3557_3 TaxID=2547429 RepID=UPI001058E01E|nr:MBL fold metallo-hydrolase [Segetibacter sp. 3557_3]TDH23511.1 MBL fold metallo-hydrolase [Segetibacter sp. 3557_3]
MKVFNVGNNAVNLYLLDSGTHLLLVDCGFPGQLSSLGRCMRTRGYKMRNIDYLLVTHFHIDHAGLIQELKKEGVKFLLIETQQPMISTMELMAARKWAYTFLDLSDNLMMPVGSSRDFLKQLDINGTIISTPGHTDDSITLVLDSGEAFTGDLPAEHLAADEQSPMRLSWTKLRAAGASVIYPGHGNVYELAGTSTR